MIINNIFYLFNNKVETKYSKATILLLLIFLAGNLNAQISGLSAGKLCVARAEVLEKGNFEFEPSFFVTHSLSSFNNSGNSVGLDGDQVASGLVFRVSFGLNENLEVGSAISSTVENVLLGGKYLFIKNESIKSSLLGGLCLPAGNSFLADSIHNDNHYLASIGDVVSVSFNEKTSADFLISYTRVFGDHPFNNILNLQGGFGYNINDEIQIVVELSGSAFLSDEFYSGKLSEVQGITYSVTDVLGIAMGLQYDVFGKNELKSLSYFAAFTILFQ